MPATIVPYACKPWPSCRRCRPRPNWQRSNVPIAWPLIGRRTPTLRGRPRSTPWPPSPRDLSRLRPRRTAPLPGPRLAPRRSVFCWPHCRPPRPVLRRPVLARQCWTGSSSVAPNCWRQGASATARLRRSDRQRAAWPQPRWHSRTRWAMRKPPPSATSNWLRTRRESRRSLLVSTNGFTVLPPCRSEGRASGHRRTCRPAARYGTQRKGGAHPDRSRGDHGTRAAAGGRRVDDAG